MREPDPHRSDSREVARMKRKRRIRKKPRTCLPSDRRRSSSLQGRTCPGKRWERRGTTTSSFYWRFFWNLPLPHTAFKLNVDEVENCAADSSWPCILSIPPDDSFHTGWTYFLSTFQPELLKWKVDRSESASGLPVHSPHRDVHLADRTASTMTRRTRTKWSFISVLWSLILKKNIPGTKPRRLHRHVRGREHRSISEHDEGGIRYR